MTRPQAVATQLIDNERTRVTRFDFAPGAETGWHVHGMDYVIVAVTDLSLTLEHPDGTTTQAHVKQGESYSRQEGVEHNVINGGTAPMSFVEIELK